MADLKSFIKSAVSSAVNTVSEAAEGAELDLSKVKSVVEGIIGSKSVLEESLGEAGSGIIDAASKVKQMVEKGLNSEEIKKGLSLLKEAVAKVKENAICAAIVKKLESLGT